MGDINVEFTEWLITLGVGGILAAFMFMVYRKDMKQFTDLWQSSTNLLIQVVQENTSSITKLVALIESQERNTIRLMDIEKMVRNEVEKATNGDK